MKDHGEKHKRECAKLATAIQEIEAIMSLPDGPERQQRLHRLMAVAEAEIRDATIEGKRERRDESC